MARIEPLTAALRRVHFTTTQALHRFTKKAPAAGEPVAAHGDAREFGTRCSYS